MNYKETLDKAREMKIDTFTLMVAEECEQYFRFDYTPDEFEMLCEVVRECYRKSDYIEVGDIARTITDFIEEEGETIKSVLSMDKWTIIAKASYYA